MAGEVPKKHDGVPEGSLLAEILAGAAEEAAKGTMDDMPVMIASTPNVPVSSVIPVVTGRSGDSTPPILPKKGARRMSAGEILRLIGSLFLALFIFFGSFLWYIVFNPTKAQFFVSLGINPGDIARLLSTLVGLIFGTITFTLSVIWIVFIFRAIRIKKDFRRQKILSIIIAVFVGIGLFMNIGVWAYLVRIINASDYENPDGTVTVYDNAKLLSSQFKNTSQLRDLSNLIGPVTLRFNIDSQARKVAKQIDITKYSLDFDSDGTSDHDGESPVGDQGIIYEFGKKRSYIPKLIFLGRDKATNEDQKVEIDLPEIKIAGLVDVKQIKQRNSGVRLQFDATDLRRFGQIEWYTSDMNTPESTDYKFMPAQVYKQEAYVCLVVFTNLTTKKTCSREFVIQTSQDSTITAKITATPDDLDPMIYHFKTDSIVAKHGIASYKWTVNDKFNAGADEAIDYTFTDVGKANIALTLTDYLGNTSTIKSTILVQKPLKLATDSENISGLDIRSHSSHAIVKREHNKLANATMITNFPIPDTIDFDAKNIQVTDPTYQLSNVAWDMEGKGTFTKQGMWQSYELIDSKRYTFIVRYTFTSVNDKKDIRTIDERIIIDSEKKDIIPSLTLKQDSEYVPTYVLLDASASSTSDGRIAKYIFDFGDKSGKSVEGDAIQKYKYVLPGEYTITLTVVRDDGKKETLTRKLILKDPPKRIVINTSVSTGYTGKPIDFDTVGTVGQVTGYRWKFGDGSVSTEASPTYTYQQAGKYTVHLIATFADGTVRSADKAFEVQELQ